MRGPSLTQPDVAYRPADGGYLVVARRSRAAADGSTERIIVGQRLSGSGTESGRDDFLITEHVNLVGERANLAPAVAVDPVSSEALVVWTDFYEVFGRRVSPTGALLARELRLSQMGPDRDPAWVTWEPDVAYNPRAGQFLVVWQSGTSNEDDYPARENIYGQHVLRDGREVGTPDFAVSTADGSISPAVAAFTDGSDFLVGWNGDGGDDAWARRVTAAPAR